MNKAKRVKSPLIRKILSEASPVKRLQNKNRVELACNIYDLIRSNGYSCSDFAKKLGRHPSEISKWVNGSHNFTMDTLSEIAYHLEVPVSALWQSKQIQTVKVTKVVVFAEVRQYNSRIPSNNYLTGGNILWAKRSLSN